MKITPLLIFFTLIGCALEAPPMVVPDVDEGHNQAVTVEPTTMNSIGIQAAIDILPTEGGIVLLRSGTWDMDPDAIPEPPFGPDIPGHVLLRDNVTLQCENGALLPWYGKSWGTLLNMNGTYRVTISNCNFLVNLDCSVDLPDDGCEMPAAWLPNTAYDSEGVIVSNGGNVYELWSKGVSASSGGPTGTGSEIVDGSAKWNHLGTDLGVPVGYHTSIAARETDNLKIIGNTWDWVGTKPYPTQTMHAVLASTSNSILSHNVVHYMQFKVGVGGAAIRENLLVDSNTFTKPFNYPVSVVSQNANEGWRNVHITNNLVLDPGSNGTIYLGPDGEWADCAELTGVQVVGNTMTGSWGTNTKGPLIRSCTKSSDWLISHNIASNNGPKLAHYGFRISDNQGHAVDNVKISDNIVGGDVGFDQHGISAGTEGDNWSLTGNIISNARGMNLSLGGKIYKVSNNIINSTSNGLSIKAQGAGFAALTVSDNTISTQAAWKRVVWREDNGLPFDVFFHGNKLVGGPNVTLWGGDPLGVCIDNQPNDSCN